MHTLSTTHSAQDSAQHIAHLIARYDDILIAAHANPDGDALGACGAMGYIVQAMGKRFVIYNESPLPESFDWLPLPCPLCHDLQNLPFLPQLAIILDCGDLHRVGPALSALLPTLVSINIDHHLATPPYASLYNWVDARMAASGQMVAAIAKALNLPLAGPLAENIFVAIVTDTGSFSYSNTSPAVLRLAAEMLDNGLDIATLRNNMENRLSLNGLRLQGELLLRFTLHHSGQVALVSVTQEDFKKYQATKEDIEGIINRLRQVRGVTVAAVLREDSTGHCKLSLRSSGDISVRVIAATMGGGGHKNASGATIEQTLPEAERLTLAAIDAYFAA